MSIDMKQFHPIFFEESNEHLEEMELLLLEVNIEAPDTEMLNSIFRAAHSIKGGSGIFGFDALTIVTHIMESLLDKIRQGKLPLEAEYIDLFLSSIDELKSILQCYQIGSELDWASVYELTKKLEGVTAGEATQLEAAEEGYGFFAEAEGAEQEESYGFFDVVEDGCFDFFDEVLPEGASIQAVVETPAVLVKACEKSSASIEGSAKKKPLDIINVENSSIRVDVVKVDQLINLVGEIVITQSMMNLLGQSLDGALGEKFRSVAHELERNTREIQEAVMSIRMLPVSFVFNRFPRVVRDLSAKLGKQIELVIEGGETELDKSLTEKLVDPLTHLVRNSIDHGIESTELRKLRGKNPIGTVILKAARQGGSIVISISDDGGGLNREKILGKAREKSILVPENPTDADVWQLIFAAGFSTADQVTDVSGRGVGMDVVRRNVQALGGRIDIESQAEKGSVITIRLPLTLAIVDGMCVSVGDQTFIIPLVNIVESMQPQAKDIKTLARDDQLLHVRNEYWPILPLYKSMELEPQFTDVSKGIAVLVETNSYRFALFVDALVGQQQVVIKSLEHHYKRVQGVAGATIMGDGGVALILDIESLALTINSTPLTAIV